MNKIYIPINTPNQLTPFRLGTAGPTHMNTSTHLLKTLPTPPTNPDMTTPRRTTNTPYTPRTNETRNNVTNTNETMTRPNPYAVNYYTTEGLYVPLSITIPLGHHNNPEVRGILHNMINESANSLKHSFPES